MVVRVMVTCNIFDFGHVAFELPMRQPEQALEIML